MPEQSWVYVVRFGEAHCQAPASAFVFVLTSRFFQLTNSSGRILWSSGGLRLNSQTGGRDPTGDSLRSQVLRAGARGDWLSAAGRVPAANHSPCVCHRSQRVAIPLPKGRGRDGLPDFRG